MWRSNNQIFFKEQSIVNINIGLKARREGAKYRKMGIKFDFSEYTKRDRKQLRVKPEAYK